MKTSFAPLVLFLFLTLSFFYPIFFQKVPIPTDLIVGGYYPWLDYKWGQEVGVAVKNSFLSDVVSVIYPIKIYAIEQVKLGQLPLWNPKMFSGYPLLANFQLGLFFPTTIFYFFFPNVWAWTLQVMTQPLLGSIFMFIFLRHLKLDNLSSVFGSIAFGFGGYVLTWLEWNVLGLTGAFFPLILFCADKLIETHKRKWGTLLSISLALQIFTGYPQVVVYSLLAVGLWILFKPFKFSSYLLLGVFTLTGLGIAAVLLVPGFELFFNSQRKSEILGDNLVFLPYRNLIAFLAPDFFGNHSTGNFWGIGNYTYISIYSGLTTLLLSIYAVVTKFRAKVVLYAICLFAVSLLVMLRNPISEFLYFSGFWGGTGATTIRMAFLINFSIALLGAFGFSNLEKNPKIFFKILVTVSVILSIILTTTFLFSHSEALDIASQLKISVRNLIIPMFLCIILLIAFFVGLYFKETYYFKFFVIFLLVTELFRFGWKFNTFSEIAYLFPETAVTTFLQSQNNERIVGFETIPANMWVPYNLSSVAGYDAVYPKSIAKYIAVLNSSDPTATSTRFGLLENKDNNLFKLTSSKNLVVLKKKGSEVSSEGEINKSLQNPRFEKVFEDKSVAVLKDKEAVERAFVVGNTEVIEEERMVLEKLLNRDFNFKNIALVNDSGALVKNEDIEKTPLIYQEVSNHKIRITGNLQSNSFVVIANTFYPGWRVFVDGQESKIYQTNFAFQGVQINKQSSIIELIYNPISLKIGALISLASFLGLLIISLIPGRIFRYGKNL